MEKLLVIFVTVPEIKHTLCERLKITRRSICDGTASSAAGRHFLKYPMVKTIRVIKIWKTVKIIRKGDKNTCLPTAQRAVGLQFASELTIFSHKMIKAL